ncbi:GGDEF domain-containing protein [Fulvimarina endophytica]|uniref:diguanylate cyclase n=1 Tax=Fulvimarina endophytica TaxID=2293836 RepID=A0A371WZI0_9HYPH|nr:GGDEF domain-containing protein [Fulvimarina endophytica]RFC62377.1 GGDEF domain-containing protein [Fulvimarina endophytica]
MTTLRSDLPGLLVVTTSLFAAAGIALLLVLGMPLLAGLDPVQQRVMEAVAGVTALSTFATTGIGLFWLFPQMRRQSKERGKLQSLTGDLERRSQDLETAALTDPLTGLNNRRFFDEAVRYYLDEFCKIGRPLGFMLLDLDHFKSINDTHGHDVGDEVLRAIATCLSDFTRPHDIVARLGGEEFAVIAPNMGRAEAEGFADRIREAIGKLAIRSGNVHLRVTVSIGIAISQRSDDVNSFYKRADVNLYNAKQSGRNRVCA